MKSLALRSAALVATASMAAILAVFFDWRGRIVRRLSDGPDPPRDVGDGSRSREDVRPADWTSYEIDDALADSFPASDPPAWTPGVARLTPSRAAAPARA